MHRPYRLSSIVYSLLLIAAPLSAQVSGDILYNTKNAGAGSTLRYFTPSTSTDLLSLNGSGLITRIPQSTFALSSHTQAISTITGLQTALDDKLASSVAASTYQPLNSALTALGTAGIGTGVLTGDGSAFSYTATSTGGNTLGLDAGKVVRFSDNGELRAASALRLTAGPTVMGIWFNEGGSVPGRLTSNTSGFGSRVWTLPNVTGTLITTGDTGTVTSDMLAGSIALSKLAITGTPDGTKFLRDDGSWQSVSSGATLGANTFTGTQTLPAGTVSAPALNFGDANTGIYRSGSGEIAFSTGGSLRYTISSSGGLLHTPTSSWLPFPGDGSFYFGGPLRARQSNGGTNIIRIDASSSTSTSQYIGWEVAGALSASFYYDAGGRIQMGVDAAAPVAQTLKAHDGSGTNIDGASLTLSGGNSTGTGDDGDVILRSTMTGSSGSTQNTPQTRAQVIARFKNLTEGAATDVVSIALPGGKVTGGTATITVWASDGTDHQTLTSEVRFGAVNKAGTVTATCAQTDGTTAASAGTLTVTCDATTSGNNVILRANATSSLTQTILRSRIVITALNGDDTQVVTPQ